MKETEGSLDEEKEIGETLVRERIIEESGEQEQVQGEAVRNIRGRKMRDNQERPDLCEWLGL